MATQNDYDVGDAALSAVVAAAIKANVAEWEQSMIPKALVSQIEMNGAKAVVDAVDAARAKGATS
jgi:hypothetical protein